MKNFDNTNHEKLGFDGEKYLEIQKKAILKRISKFSGRLYLEIGGKFLFDPHASRVLPGFLANSKKQIFYSLRNDLDIIYCINSKDLIEERKLSSKDLYYFDYVLDDLEKVKKELFVKPKISINIISKENLEKIKIYRKILEKKGYEVYFKYKIKGYPKNTKNILSDNGYGKDEFVKVSKNLVLVMGVASNSGKMCTCLSQIYKEHLLENECGYAKYETFPIWNLDLSHPVNLAYEASTADIGDYNVIDSYHKKIYGKNSVNYNRDAEAFEIVSNLASKFLPKNNFTRSYKSPTDMGINNAGFCIIDEKIVKKASIEEIKRRINWYQKIIDKGNGEKIWVERCKKLLEKIN